MPKYQATSYIRLSYTDDRSSESDSVTNQRKLIENFIERNPDIEIISEKIDDGDRTGLRWRGCHNSAASFVTCAAGFPPSLWRAVRKYL